MTELDESPLCVRQRVRREVRSALGPEQGGG